MVGFLGWLKRLFAPRPAGVQGMVVDEARAIEEFAQHLGIHFRDPDLLKLALTHRSFLHVQRGTSKQSNERLEFLGDSVLGVIVSEHLYKTFPEEHEGQLTKTKSLLVSKAILSRRALAMGLGRFVLMSNSEVDSGGRQRLSILADAFESVLGAIYLDQGIEAARDFVNTWLLSEARGIVSDKRHTNYKSLLQEYVQSAFHTHPVYRIRHEHGPDHSKLFTVEVVVNGRNLGSGKGKNKKEAEQSAARDALDRVAQDAAEKNREREPRVREERLERAPRSERTGRIERAERPERAERTPRAERERPERAERGERPERGMRVGRPERESRPAREPYDEMEPRPEREPRVERERELHVEREPRPGREPRFDREPRAEREPRPEREPRVERAARPERPGRERGERPERMERPERAERPEREGRAERPERPERDRERRPAASAEAPATTPAPAPVAAGRPSAPIDLSGGLLWESEPAAGPRPGMSYGRQPAVKSRTGGVAPPTSDPSRRPTVSEAPASAPRSEPATVAPRGESEEPEFKVESQVREVKGPLPGVDASRYRAAEAPASRFSSETPTVWDEEPKEHE